MCIRDRAHTAVKIEPEYSGCVIHVNDASKAVPVASNLLNKNQSNFKKEIKDEYETIRERFLNKKNEKRFISLKDARINKHKIDWGKIETYKPLKLGINKINIEDLNVLKRYIDWTQFFRSWNLHGIYPAIFKNEINGKQAKQLSLIHI